MKQLLLIFLTTVQFGLLTSYAQLFPKVDKPAMPESSMLVLQFAHDDNGTFRNVINNNFSGWAPVVKDANGTIIPFKKYDAAADITNIYYAENLSAGEYTLIGFYHVYTNYGKLAEYEKEIGKQIITSYEPYADNKYHIKQLFSLTEPVKIDLVAGKVMSLGSYAVKYKWVEGAAGTTDERWKMKETETAITKSAPFDEHIVRYIKTWKTPNWKKWNERNPAAPL